MARFNLGSNITVNDSVLNEDGILNADKADKFRTWMPIGFYYDINHDDLPEMVYYKGSFDGNGHTISGLYLNNKEQGDAGLFGQISEEAEIRNVGVINSYFYGDYRIGGICGSNYGTIINSYNSSIVKSDDIAIGGVCGANFGTITNSYNSGNISSSSRYVGGVCGVNEESGKITNSYNSGSLSGNEDVGGVCGYNLNMITNCYYDKDKYSGNGVGKNSGEAIGKTTAEFKKGKISYFLSLGENGSIWGQSIGIDDYPVLGGEKAYEPANKTNDKYDLDGDGVKDEVYEISSAGQLYWFAELVNGTLGIVSQNTSANAVLTNDITVNDSVLNEDGILNADKADKFRTWMPIGFYYDINHDDLPEMVYYKGSFDGNGHTISGLYLNNKEQGDAGLFGQISEEAEIRNVGVINSYFYGDYRIGGICGSNYGTIINSYNSSIVKSDDIAIGGVCGANFGTITNSYNSGNISSSSRYVGGVCGVNEESGKITNSYNSGSLSGNEYVGGICGYNLNMITNCCYDKDKYTGNGVGNNSGENIGKTTAEFKSGEIAFLLSQGEKGSVWGQLIGTNDYPVLDSTKRVYRNVTYTGCSEAYKGDLNYVYSNTEITNPIYREHDYASGGVCKNCDSLKNGKDGFKSASITLTDGVIMNYYMILSHEALDDKEAYIHFTSEQGIDEKIKLSKGSEVDGKYKFSLKLRPDQMSDEITAKVVYGDTTEGSGITYSVKQYAENLSQNEKVLADAMLKFGAFTQKYTGNNIDNLAADVTDLY